jgi:oligogalacturonide lyase
MPREAIVFRMGKRASLVPWKVTFSRCGAANSLTILRQAQYSMRNFVFLIFAAARLVYGQAALPTEWIDPDTGHRVIRLSREDGTASLYFHQNAYSADGKKLVVTNRHGIATVNLATRAIDQVVEGHVNILVTGHKTGQIYYTKDGAIFATDLDTHATREVAKMPAQRGAIAVNADETMLVGIAADPDGKTVPRTAPPGGGGGRLEENWASGTPKMLYTIDIKTGKFRKIYGENDWTNHLQMSPTDPNLIMFCHEGPWHFNDRVWTIRTDGTGLQLMHERTMNMEIAGHEFFSADGKTVWYDLQTPKSAVFWVAGVELATGHRTRYNLQRNEMVCTLQHFGGREAVCGRWRRAEQCGRAVARQRDAEAARQRTVDLPVPAGDGEGQFVSR